MEGENRQTVGEEQEHFILQEVPKIRPPPNQQCPRCQSLDTRFCYFSNNKRDQPRYFCKTCKRQWTQGGRLRDIPPRGSRKKARRGGVRDAISSPSPSVGFGASRVHNLHLPGGGVGFAIEENTSHPKQAATGLITFTPGNNLSLLRGSINGLNPLIIKPFGQHQAQGQGQGHPVGQLYQAADPIQGFTTHPNRATGLQTQPDFGTSTTTASASAAANYPPINTDAYIYWENVSTIVSYNSAADGAAELQLGEHLLGEHLLGERQPHQRQAQGQGQGQGHSVGQLYQAPHHVQGFATHPNRATGLWALPDIGTSTTAASASVATNYPPIDTDADIYWENNVSTEHLLGEQCQPPQHQALGQGQGHSVGQLYQAPHHVQGFATLPNQATGLWAPPDIGTSTTAASASAATNYPPIDTDADIYWEDQLYQAPHHVQRFATLPNRATGLWAPPDIGTSTTAASASAATNYPPIDTDADIYWENNVSTISCISGGSSSMDWFSQFPGAWLF